MSNYRQSPFANLTPVVKSLLIINVVFYLASRGGLSLNLDLYTPLSGYFFGSQNFRPWQIITYMFLHAPNDIMHILFNMIALFMFGPALEMSLGSKRFFNFYFIAGIGALLMQWGVQAIEVHNLIGTFMVNDWQSIAGSPLYDKLFDIVNGPVIGASGAIFGILVGFGMLFPDVELMIIFFPIPIKAKYLISIYIVVELFLGIGRFSGDSVAHFAHIGGGLFGYIMIKIWGLNRRDNFYH
jgi:membrane associated rhomboid family serine protease